LAPRRSTYSRHLEEAVRDAEKDRRSGASEIADRLAGTVARVGARLPKREVLAGLARVVRAHPAMAPIRALLARLRREPGSAIAPAAKEFRMEARHGFRRVVDEGAKLVRHGSVVAIHSWSGTVIDALARAHSLRRRFSLLASVSGGHGEHAAGLFEAMGVTTCVQREETFLRSLAVADLVLLGADAVTPRAVVNAAGTRAVAAHARRLGVPVYVLADPTKFVRGPLRGVSRDVRFDRTSIGWVTVVSGGGSRRRFPVRAPRRGR
jgi:translation initiation factor 2B subunit (eIF-2B alpha/beta/delta family)